MLLFSYNTQKYVGMGPQDATPRERVSYKMLNKWGPRLTVWSAWSPHWLYTCKPNKSKKRGPQTVEAITCRFQSYKILIITHCNYLVLLQEAGIISVLIGDHYLLPVIFKTVTLRAEDNPNFAASVFNTERAKMASNKILIYKI